MKIKFTDLNKINKKYLSAIKMSFSNIVKKDTFIGGKIVKNFEEKFLNYCNSKYCISVANGTDALEIAIESLNLPSGSEVIIPANTWISAAEAVLRNNLKVVFCDIKLQDYTICHEDLKRKITNKTKLVIVVHLYGNVVDMDSILKITKKRNIKIIEDCAQAIGSKYKNKHVGVLGDIGTFSFYPSKNLGCFGDGGCIVTNAHKIAEKCKRIKNHGSLIKHDHLCLGRNSRLDTIQADILIKKMNNLNNLLLKRKILANVYYDQLKNINELNCVKKNSFSNFSYHQFVIRTRHRDLLMNFLKKNKIETMIHYPKMLTEISFLKKFNDKKLNNSFKLGSYILSLPISEEHSVSEVIYVTKKIKSFFKSSLNKLK